MCNNLAMLKRRRVVSLLIVSLLLICSALFLAASTPFRNRRLNKLFNKSTSSASPVEMPLLPTPFGEDLLKVNNPINSESYLERIVVSGDKEVDTVRAYAL